MTKKLETFEREDLIRRKDDLYYREDANLWISSVPFTGIVKGNEDSFKYTEIYKNGEWHGPQESYHVNGQLRSKQNYKKGKLHGLSEFLNENGQLEIKEYYKNGKLIKIKNFKDG